MPLRIDGFRQVTPTKFRLLIAAALVCSTAGAFLDFQLSPTPEDAAGLPELWAIPLWSVLALLLVSIITVAVGLWRFSWWSRLAAVVVTLTGIAGLSAFSEPFHTAPLAEAFYDAGNLLTGAILAAAYWSPLRGRFDRPGTAPHTAGEQAR